MEIIEIKNVHKSYGNKEILHGMNMGVKEGSIHGLVGRNGSGKTTLIRCLTGIYKADKGEILVNGKPVYENPEAKVEMGYVADLNQYFSGYYVDEMVEFYEGMYPSFDKDSFYNYNEVVGLDILKRIRELSKGQSMALASMLNLSIHPKVLVMDEPLSGLDPIAQKQIKEFVINEVDMYGMTVLISSHDLKDLEAFCDSVSMVKEGKVVCHGSMDEIKDGMMKIQAVFKDGLPGYVRDIPSIVTYSNIGSVYTIIFSEVSTSMIDILCEMGASMAEQIPMSLEEIFLFSNR
ncbi:MAG: ABC transporter ATP-binding protein [Anaerostipes sp.]|jgi:ABC-2 type transport system ATP-binding protein|nr:ABC transporter ATP-binding protein [Anaerostipes sp.]